MSQSPSLQTVHYPPPSHTPQNAPSWIKNLPTPRMPAWMIYPQPAVSLLKIIPKCAPNLSLPLPAKQNVTTFVTPLVDAIILAQWNARQAVWKLAAPATITAQKKFLCLMHLDDASFVDTFRKWAVAAQWSPSTMSTYFNTALTTKKILTGSISSPALQKMQKILNRTAIAAQKCNQPSVSRNHIKLLMDMNLPLCIPMILAWTLGQRISDILLLRQGDLMLTPTHLTIFVRRGKVVPIIGPYCLFLALENPLTASLKLLMNQRSDDPLWTDNGEVAKI